MLQVNRTLIELSSLRSLVMMLQQRLSGAVRQLWGGGEEGAAAAWPCPSSLLWRPLLPPKP